jgi:hypothetical protein
MAASSLDEHVILPGGTEDRQRRYTGSRDTVAVGMLAFTS